ncbi:carbonic anhydrase [Ophiostoma piceae UAMH 11346]|uniref:carbonic anhydrase n=1 Tax=Ophiostoma piceae (strain UAMH 11346) TaxID=1262450 RepID=S3C8L0_OPHP1|nr:carbonic anhydrase [Ophiostoma piceae UAMH 11346]
MQSPFLGLVDVELTRLHVQQLPCDRRMATESSYDCVLICIKYVPMSSYRSKCDILSFLLSSWSGSCFFSLVSFAYSVIFDSPRAGRDLFYKLYIASFNRLPFFFFLFFFSLAVLFTMLHINSYLLLIASFAAEHAYASCAYGTHLHARAEEGGVKVNTFGYTGSISPLNWLSLDPAANTACATGRNQSPIDMTEGQFSLISAADVALNIPDIEETEIENLGTTVEVVVPEGTNATMTSGGTVFSMKQFHFHLPSEHLDAGRSFAMEMHMVFESADGKIAVLGNYLDTANGPNVVAGVKGGSAGNASAAAKRSHARDILSERQVQVVRLGTDGATATPASTSSTQSVIDKLLQLLGGGLAGNAAGSATGGTTSEKIEATKGAAGGATGGTATGAATGAAAAVGVDTAGSALINTVWASASQVATPGTKAKIGPLVMSGLADSIKAASLQTYAGSLTTPPCSEGVSWFVSTQKQTVSLNTFETARDIIGFNSRFPQNKLGEPNVLALAASANNGAAAAAAAANAAKA